jgi:hypothetical protein
MSLKEHDLYHLIVFPQIAFLQFLYEIQEQPDYLQPYRFIYS